MLKSLSLSKFLSQHGQVLIFNAVLVPFLLMFAGVGLDLGWYYLNVSRLQNAADAAAVAGAQALLEDEDFLAATKSRSEERNSNNENYQYAYLVDEYPTNSPSDISTKTGDAVAEEYVVKNLGENQEIPKRDSEGKLLNSDGIPISNSAGYKVSKDDDGNWVVKDSKGKKLDNVTFSTKEIIRDDWSKGGDHEVTMTPSLYNDDNGLYYVIHLTEKIQHLFMPGWFGDMDAPVVAVAMLSKTESNGNNDENSNDDDTPPPPEIIPRDPGVGAEGGLPEGTNILNEMYKLEDKSVMRNWEWQTYATEKQYAAITNGAEKYKGNVNEYQDSKVHYQKGTLYRYEKAEVRAGSSNQGSSQGKMYNYTEEQGIDSLNLDFKADIDIAEDKKQFEKDWDINHDIPKGLTLKPTNNDGYSGTYDNNYENSNDARNYRVHSTFNFTTPYKVRQNRTEEQVAENPEDALHVRIESDPIRSMSFKESHNVYSTVRQIFLNINQPNTGANARPLIFYYDGPESYDQDKTNENYDPDSHVRDSQPVILTLNADARVILFAPNSPVVIRGNGHKMQGFVIAKEFHRLMTKNDYTIVEEDGVKRYFDRKDSTKEYFYIQEEDTFVDSVGNVQTKKLSLSDSKFTRDRYSDTEQPEDPSVIESEDYEKVYKLSAFNLSNSSYYDSFNVPKLTRNIYTYLDNYKDKTKPNSIDMFFTKYRSTWIN